MTRDAGSIISLLTPTVTNTLNDVKCRSSVICFHVQLNRRCMSPDVVETSSECGTFAATFMLTVQT